MDHFVSDELQALVGLSDPIMVDMVVAFAKDTAPDQLPRRLASAGVPQGSKCDAFAAQLSARCVRTASTRRSGAS